MRLKFLGPDPRVPGDAGPLRPQVATIFPAGETLVTVPGIHISQRSAYVDSVEQARREEQKPPLSQEERDSLWASAVDLFLRRDTIEIRPDPEQMELAFQADSLLQELLPKHRVRFLLAGNAKVHDAIQRAGECWRITPRPISTKDAIQLIQSCRLGIGGRRIYYHSPATGTRLVTCQEFADLALLDDKALQDHLIEIQYYSRCFNRYGNPEVDFFVAGRKFWEHLVKLDFSVLRADSLRAAHAALSQQFASIVPAELRRDDASKIAWRQRMLSELQPLADDRVLEEKLLGMAPEFHRHIQWLPGGRIEHGELILDSFFDEATPCGDEEVEQLLDERARGLIYNFVRDYAHLEYINVGRVAESLALDRKKRGRRGVYVVELKQQGDQRDIVKIIRLQKWDVSERLDRGDSLLDAMLGSEEYTDYVLDRRLGCRRLGMNIPGTLVTSKIREVYRGRQKALHGKPIWTAYFERDYVDGTATDKLPEERFQREGYALRFAELLGQAAAPNMIVGRCDDDNHIFFDDGDEVIIENDDGLPVELIVAHHTGSFFDFRAELARCAPEYADPLNERLKFVPDRDAFVETYLSSFVRSFQHIQAEYQRRPRAFDTLFQHRPCDPGGSFAFRWGCVLKRLEAADPVALAELIRAHVRPQS